MQTQNSWLYKSNSKKFLVDLVRLFCTHELYFIQWVCHNVCHTW